MYIKVCESTNTYMKFKKYLCIACCSNINRCNRNKYFSDDCRYTTGRECKHGACLNGQCHCNDGYGGKGCDMPDDNECKV